MANEKDMSEIKAEVIRVLGEGTSISSLTMSFHEVYAEMSTARHLIEDAIKSLIEDKLIGVEYKLYDPRYP